MYATRFYSLWVRNPTRPTLDYRISFSRRVPRARLQDVRCCAGWIKRSTCEENHTGLLSLSERLVRNCKPTERAWATTPSIKSSTKNMSLSTKITVQYAGSKFNFKWVFHQSVRMKLDVLSFSRKTNKFCASTGVATTLADSNFVETMLEVV